jgi:UDP-N-acetylmuramyl pentapeptide phosphotransferase/UDP-N-acetylglucosamine-1-phosphate transferase
VSEASIAALIAFGGTVALLWLLLGPGRRIALDRPNRRSLHERPTPRTGGLAMLGGAGAAALTLPWLPPMDLALAFAVLVAVSLLDDFRGMPVVIRFPCHLIAAGWAAVSILGASHGVLVAGFAALAIAWMINLYNFMDGSDGLAGGMTVFGFGFYGVAAWLAGSTEFALVNLSIAAAAGAFLVFNFHPARIFMGDAGSAPLGFLAAALGLIGWLQQDWTWWFPLLVFSPFILDASVTLARRLLRGEKVWQAHRDHYYQRLVRLGWGHGKTALAEYAVMLACGAVALAALALPADRQAALLAAVAASYLVVIALIEVAWRRAAESRK